MAQITYADKSAMNVNSSIADTNKVNASDMNEIKSVVNSNYTELLNAVNENANRLNNLFYYEDVTLASNITIKANSNYGDGTQTKTISPRAGYKPVMVVLNNAWNRTCYLWYCNLVSDTKINWRAGNITNSQITGISIQVRVLYIKSSCVAA